MDKGYQYTTISSTEEPAASNATNYWKRRFYILLFSSLSTILLLLAGISYRFNISSDSLTSDSHEAPYSPVPLNYVNRYLESSPDASSFMGHPRPELDQAWHNLLEGTLIRLSEDELLLANNASSIRHKDGGYVGGLGVSHSLHCLKRIKQYLHPNYYYKNEEEDWDELTYHVDHCLESLRQEVLCTADVTIYTLQWRRPKRKPIVTVPQPHACVDWEGLHKWMIGRAAKYDDMIRPNIEGDNGGAAVLDSSLSSNHGSASESE
ncbi:hypothetical protein F4814DRAFT_443850 [Daldinia grandis]|nr:hypothetical protein F4814DRAFT_443850 [Daldinia grandis]